MVTKGLGFQITSSLRVIKYKILGVNKNVTINSLYLHVPTVFQMKKHK